MKRSSVPDCVMLCPTCPGDPGRIAFRSEQVEVRCGTCRAHFRVQTRRIADTTQQTPRGDMQRYRVFTAEPSGRVKMRRFEAPIGIKLLRDERVTFVWRAGRLMGVANQTAQTWYALPHMGRTRGFAMRLTFMATVPLAGGALYGAWPLTEPLRALSPAAIIAAVIIAAICGAPWLAGLRTSHESAPAVDNGQKQARSPR